MESLGWGVAGVLVVFVAGLLVGLYLMSKRPIINNVTQNVNHAVNVSSSGGGVVRSVAGAVVPVLALGAVAVVALAAVSSSANANQQISDTAQRSIEAQQQIVKAMPQPQVIVQPATPPQVTVNTPTFDLMPLVNAIGAIAASALAVFVASDIIRMKIRQRRQDQQRARDRERALFSKPQAHPMTHPLFDAGKAESGSEATEMSDQRHTLLKQFAAALDTAAQRGALTRDASKPIGIKEIGAIAGPRAGALEISAGLDAGRLLRVLQADDGAIVRQFIPWPFPLSPSVYMAGRYVRVEAGWPDDLAERAIKVSDLNRRPYGSGRWLAGVNELGRVVTLGLSDHAPHFLVSGTTGSGKSVAIRSMVVQLARNGDQLILIDGKFGEGLRGLDHLPNVIGPLATDMDTARSAAGVGRGRNAAAL